MTALLEHDQVQVWSEIGNREQVIDELIAMVRALDAENRALRDLLLGHALDRAPGQPGAATLVHMSYAGRTRRFIHRRFPDHHCETLEV